MSKLLHVVITILFPVGILTASCSKSNTPEVEEETDDYKLEALAAYDESNAGIYKGVLVNGEGSGSLKMTLLNGNPDIKIYFNFNGYFDTLTTTLPITIGQRMNQAMFTGKRTKLWFSVEANGNNPNFSAVLLDNVSVLGRFEKEKSYQFVHYYKGTFMGTDASNRAHSGRLNGLLVENKKHHEQSFRSVFIADGMPFGNPFSGAIKDGNYSIPENPATGFSFEGVFKDKQASGTWNNSLIFFSGTWSCQEFQ